ncbi:hypothetical protein J1614_012179 [Plenodomus biglobosus]|nr:hypothetical protein J1614_012179 [Plenodomus biglobosus]
MLVFSYNKASTRSNNSFYIVRVPCAVVERALFLYLAYIRPFGDFLVRQLKLVNATVPTNPHLFTISDNPTACFSLAACSKSLQQATPECPITLNLQVYRQIAVSISKKHIPALLQPFDPNMPKDYDGFLHLLSFQTGHNPSTHAGAYALDRAYPAKLQPDLIDRYFESSFIWHRFARITESDPLTVDVDSDMDRLLASSTHQTPRYPFDAQNEETTVEIQEVDISEDTEDDAQGSLPDTSLHDADSPQASSQLRKRKQSGQASISPTLKRIKLMEKELARIKQSYKRRK